MGLEFLARVRRSSLALAVVAAMFAATYAGPARGLAIAAGAAWSLLNLALIERLVVTLTGPRRGEPTGVIHAGAALTGMLALFGAGAFLLTKLPVATLAIGFAVPFAVITLKAASLLLLGSRAWRRFARDPRRATGVLVALVISALAAWPLITRAAEEHAESGPQKFPTFITVIERAFPHAGWAHFIGHYETVIFSLIVAFLLVLVAFLASRNPQMIPSGLQNAVEAMVEGLYGFIAGIIGEQNAPRFVPFLGTLGLYIWCMNLFGIIPFMESPTSSLNITFALGLIVFLYAQWIGIRGLGPIGYVHHLLGSPRDFTGWVLAPLMLPIHILGELAKPISLSCRLFGNIFGEDMLLVAFVSLGITSVSFLHLPIGLPLQVPFLLLALLTSTLQAAVFMVLSTIYFLLMLPHDEHGHEEAHPQHAH
jgi:F-type H+-transporting ATPase subunit a